MNFDVNMYIFVLKEAMLEMIDFSGKENVVMQIEIQDNIKKFKFCSSIKKIVLR